jgi:hypothetical protein
MITSGDFNHVPPYCLFGSLLRIFPAGTACRAAKGAPKQSAKGGGEHSLEVSEFMGEYSSQAFLLPRKSAS